MELKTVQLSEKVKYEVNRFKKLQNMFLGKKTSVDIQNIDLRDYMKFVLKEGSILDKRLILDCIKSEIVLRDRKICLV
jgi:hypothetical protein